MTPDDPHAPHNHGFELPDAPQVVVQHDSRRWRAVAGVAVCLGLAGVVTGLIVARRQSASDAHLTSDALQREELRDGWRALGAAAAQEAQANDVQAAAPPTPVAPPSVVIVNVPAPSANAAPPNVTNITLPSGANVGSNAAPTNDAIGAAPIQSMPAISFSPGTGYIPTPTYVAPRTNDPAQNGYSPQNSYGTTGGTAAPYSPPVGNGTIPGSTSNPALVNNGLVGSTPTPGQPNGNPTPSAPVGTVPVSPGSPSLPSGFSAP